MALSVASPAHGLDVQVLVGFPLELVEILGGILEVLPGSLGRHVEAALRIRRPSVAEAVVMVVRVRVEIVLVTVVGQVATVQVVAGLQDLGQRAGVVPSLEREEGEERHGDAPEPEERQLGMLSLDDVLVEGSAELVEERLRVGRLRELDLVVSGQSMVAHDTLQ